MLLVKMIRVSAVALLAAGCALLPGSNVKPDEFDEEVPEHLTLEVQNDNFYDATIYAVRLGQRLRIGWVGGHTTQTFQFKWPALDLSFEIALLAVGSYYTYPLPVDAGDELALTVLPDLHHRRPGTVF